MRARRLVLCARRVGGWARQPLIVSGFRAQSIPDTAHRPCTTRPMGPLAERVRRFWFELWNHRAMDAVLEELHPDYTQTDHRALTDSGGNRSEWGEVSRAWWEVVPDVAAVEFEPLGEKGSVLVYHVVFSGHDAVSGGQAEAAFHIVVGVRDGLFASVDMFEDRDAALACFDARTATAI